MPRGREIGSSASTEPDDLCLRCRFAGLCVFCSRGQDPVCHCPSFAVVENAEEGADGNGSPPFRGLCVNCLERSRCSRERPAEGVWHCPDYC
jgi:hypothetical protein